MSEKQHDMYKHNQYLTTSIGQKLLCGFFASYPPPVMSYPPIMSLQMRKNCLPWNCGKSGVTNAFHVADGVLVGQLVVTSR